jgi:N-carbamoyl-L-amino-acid hydrolase
MVQLHSNSRNVIPGRVKFSIALRNSTDALVDQMADEMKACATQVSKESGLAVQIEYASPEHITAGCNVLLHAVLERTGT